MKALSGYLNIGTIANQGFMTNKTLPEDRLFPKGNQCQ